MNLQKSEYDWTELDLPIQLESLPTVCKKTIKLETIGKVKYQLVHLKKNYNVGLLSVRLFDL